MHLSGTARGSLRLPGMQEGVEEEGWDPLASKERKSTQTETKKMFEARGKEWTGWESACQAGWREEE